jgi:hypothetical protein
MTNIISNSTPCWRVTADVIGGTIEVYVKPVIAWADPGPAEAFFGDDYTQLEPICVTGGEVVLTTRLPVNYVITELNVDELKSAVTYLVNFGWRDEVYQAEKAGLRWRVDDTIYSLTGLPDQVDGAPGMTPEQSLEFKNGRGGAWAVAEGVDADEVAQHADDIDTYAAALRAKYLPDVLKFHPVSVGELFAAPKNAQGARAVGEE